MYRETTDELIKWKDERLKREYRPLYEYDNELLKQSFFAYVSNNNLTRDNYHNQNGQRHFERMKNDIDSLLEREPNLQDEYDEYKQKLIEFANECDECVRIMSIPEKRQQYDTTMNEILALLEKINSNLTGPEKEETENIINTIKRNGYVTAKFLLGTVGVIANLQAVFPTASFELVQKITSLSSIFYSI